MPIVITVLLLFITAAALAILPFARPRFRFSWLLGIAMATAAWLSVLVWLPVLPVSLEVPLWQSVGSANSFATFAVSGILWPYALCLVTVPLAVLLTAPARPRFPSPASWAICLAAAGVGILAVTASGPLTLVLFWAGLDLVEGGVVLARAENRAAGPQASYAFALRLLSIALVLLALVLGDTSGAGARFGDLQGSSALLLSGAALLRLTALAAPWLAGPAVSRIEEVGTTIQLVAGAATIAFLAQLRPEAQNGASGLLLLCIAASLYAGWMWLRAPSIAMARPLWVMGLGCLAVAAALRGDPAGVTAWGSTSLLLGVALFLTTVRTRRLNWPLLLGVWMGSAMPFALTAAAWLTRGSGPDWSLLIFLFAQGMLLAGFLHRALRPEIQPPEHPAIPSLRGMYQLGIWLPLAVGLLLGFGGWPGSFQFGAPAAAALLIPVVGVLAWGKQRLAFLNPVPTQWISPRWSRVASAIRREAARLQGGALRMNQGLTRTIEGEAGIMWSLLLLVLFVSLIARAGR